MSDIKLDLGCGGYPTKPQNIEPIDDTWTLIDLYVDHPKIVKMDVRKLEYPDNSVTKIYSGHTLEHIPYPEIVYVLKEWYRVLKTGGELILNVPDLEWACQAFLKSYTQNLPTGSSVYPSWEDFMPIFYGLENHDGEFHKSGFTEKSLMSALIDAGFKMNVIIKQFETHDMGCLVSRSRK
jgi:predicted SAM-dependent methyltransferase